MLKRFMKPWISIALIIALTLSILPVFPGSASASQPSFFYPDDNALSIVANQVIPPAGLSKAIAYTSSTKLLTITGAYNALNSDSLKVKVEQMVNTGGTTWDVDPNRTFTKAVTAIGNRFEAPNLQLFTGYNKVTLSGTKNGSEMSDFFYVLYEDVPYLLSLKVGAGSDEPFDLNEGAARVVKKPPTTDPNYRMMVYIQGQAINATKVVLNGNTVSPTDDGQFFAPPVQLKPGKNDIKIVLSNDSNTVEVTRTLFYYDSSKPFVDVLLDRSSTTDGVNSIMTGSPVLTDNNPASKLDVSLLVPYQAMPFDAPDATVTIDTYKSDGSTDTVSPPFIAAPSETVIYAQDGTPEFKYVNFQTNYTLDTLAKNVTLTVNYGTGPTQFTAINNKLSYKYYQGSIKINSIKLLNNYGTPNVSKVDLNNSEVSDSDFYIEVTADKDISAVTTLLGAKLLPYSTTPLTVTRVSVLPGNLSAVYKVSNLPSGNQQIQFGYTVAGVPSLSTFDATVIYVSKNYISVDNLYNGQVITVDSSSGTPPGKTITGSFVNFTNFINPQVSVNGVSLPAGVQPSGGYYTVNAVNSTFSIYIPFTGYGSFYYGENHVVIRAQDSFGNTIQTIEKNLSVYIVDKNVPVITNFKPLEIPTGIGVTRPPLSSSIFGTPLKELRFDTDKYFTKLKEIDLGVEGSGADHVTVSKAGVTLLDMNTDGTGISNPSGITFDRSGDSNGFILRLKNLPIPETGSHVFTVEFRNSTGARVTQRLEIVREIADIIVWSPVPNVGDRIVVNKNFVLFDVEAEGAVSVSIDGKAATLRPDLANRFTYNYIGLKPEKEQTIKIIVTTSGGTKTRTVKVLYTGPVEPGAQYMEKMSTKHTVFNGGINLTFPKNTVLKTANPELTLEKTPKFYDRQNLFFGVASSTDGVVERVNDYGQIKGTEADSRTYKEQSAIIIDSWLSDHFTNPSKRDRFNTISPIYWISGGLGESKGLGLDKERVDGLDPYSVEGAFTKYAAERKIVPTNRGELTLKFNGSVVDAAGTIVTVFYFNDQGEWTNLGGKVDTKKNTITVPFNDFGYYMVAKLKEGYSDVTNHPWARNVLEALYAKGFMENARYDEFGTDDFTTRGEFTTLLVRALNLPLNYDDTNTFFDVFPGANALWKYPEIETAARAGIITGLDNRYFGVNQRITREQAATMIQRASDLKAQMNDNKLAAALQKQFTDFGDMSYYALPAIQAVNKAGVMVGLPNELMDGQKKPTVRFDPKANMTRAQAGAIVVRLLQKNSTIFPKNFN